MAIAFTEAEILAALRPVMSEDDAQSFVRVWPIKGGPNGDRSGFTLDTLILLSLHSPELEARVSQWCVPLFAGPHGERRRREFDAQREVIKAARDSAIETGIPWTRDDV